MGERQRRRGAPRRRAATPRGGPHGAEEVPRSAPSPRRQHRRGVRRARGRPARRHHARAGTHRRGARRLQARDGEGDAAQSRAQHRRDEAQCPGRREMRLLLRAAFVAALLALAGCTSWNPLVAVGILAEPANKPTPLGPVKSTVPLRAAWTVSVGKSGGYAFRPAYEGGRIYAAAADGTITILEEDGRVATRIDTKKRLSGGLLAEQGILIAGCLKGEVIALDLAGKPRWEAHVAGEVIAPAAVSKKVAVVRTSDGRIFGLSLDDGKRAWVFQRASPALLLHSGGGVLAIGGDVVAGYPNGKLIALDIDDGKLTWEVTVSLPRGATELARIADVAGVPLGELADAFAVAMHGHAAC